MESIINFSSDENSKVIVSFKDFLLNNIFGYYSFRSNKFNSIFSYGIFKEILYCPYCNIQEIQFIKREVNRKSQRVIEYQALFDLDHFLLKSKYPYFSLSFFNLIPCCAVCNSRIRGSKDFFIGKNYHPYNDNFDEICRFKIDVDSYLSDKEDICIDLNKGFEFFQKTIDDMHLISLYSTNNREQLKTIVDKYRNNQTYGFLSVYIEVIRRIKADFFKSHIPFVKKDILKKSRCKMLRDIFRESVDLKCEYPFDD